MQEQNTQNSWQVGLNDHQLRAVTTDSPYALVLAGAGSGKTRVLISRLLYLFLHKQLGPAQVLALTFTNKAANEMRTRLANSFPWANHVWMGTFHGIAHRLLRLHAQEAKLSPSFTIIDSEDQQRLCKRILREFQVDDKVLSSKTLAYLISREKDAGRRASDTLAIMGEQPWLRFYEAYETACQEAQLVDFGELLLRSYELFAQNARLLNHYQGRFRHILVDEFQDTNRLQYQWIKLLAGEACSVFVVGDDDQSIYGWRGAEVENIQDFVDTMVPCEVIRLEQNYRSTQTILTAANALIAHNTQRMGKALWSAQDNGDSIIHHIALNDYDEAKQMVHQIRLWQQERNPLKEVAILYRSNHQSRVLEQIFMQENIPYKITGGMRFFERAEIKDALAYARLLLNHQDDAAFDRIINMPTRGLGAKSLEKIHHYAKANHLSYFRATQQMIEQKQLTGKALTGASAFVGLFEHWQSLRADHLSILMESIIRSSGLWDFYAQDTLTGEGREENLEELINTAHHYHNEMTEELQDQDPLTQFLAQAALDAGETHQTPEDAVQMMTIHAAKGLEFDLVMITGLEESTFPLLRATQEDMLAEERRLMYVAMTRAKQKLMLSSSQMRRIHGTEMLMTPSRFIDEIPLPLRHTRQHVQAHRTHRQPNMMLTPTSTPSSLHPFPVNSKVHHERFGDGLVLAVDGMGDDARVQVRFADATRWLLLTLAKLEKV